MNKGQGLRVGWCTESFNGSKLLAAPNCWAYDCQMGRVVGEEGEDKHDADHFANQNDFVLGCLVDTKSRSISFSVNGNIRMAFE